MAYAILRRVFTDRDSAGWRILKRARWLTRFAAIFLGIVIALPAAELDAKISSVIRHILQIGMIVLLGWASVAAINAASSFVGSKSRLDVEDNLEARKFHTQLGILRRVSLVIVVLITFAAVLMTYPAVRAVGFSLLASAGAAGLILGLAARPILANLIAGVQIALTQPIRIEDVVIIEGEWGWIEEITTTYVVVRIWDLRRLIVPLNYFVERPFQNWTRESSSIIGVVTWNLDYRAPIEAIREELQSLVATDSNWDKRIVNLQVVDADHRTIKVRALVSARNSQAAWDLRCAIRKQMISWLQRAHPDALPRIRAEHVSLPDSTLKTI
jgi:small-conductance mechanosensitive channel